MPGLQQIKLFKYPFLFNNNEKAVATAGSRLGALIIGTLLLGGASNLQAQSDLPVGGTHNSSHLKPPNKLPQQSARLISGYVYETFTSKKPVPAAIIKVSDGFTTSTDKTGFYQINLKRGDTVRFYDPTGRLAVTYPAAYLLFYQHFNVYLQDPEYLKGQMDLGHELAEVKVTGRDYLKDSLMRRYLYSDIFAYKKPTLADAVTVPKIGKVPIPIALGVSVSGVIRWLQSQKNNKDLRFKQFAFYAEDEGYINHRLSPSTIELFTGIKDEDSIRYFKNYYRPTAMQLRDMNDLELGQYLMQKAHDFRIGALPQNAPSFPDYQRMYQHAQNLNETKTSEDTTLPVKQR